MLVSFRELDCSLKADLSAGPTFYGFTFGFGIDIKNIAAATWSTMPRDSGLPLVDSLSPFFCSTFARYTITLFFLFLSFIHAFMILASLPPQPIYLVQHKRIQKKEIVARFFLLSTLFFFKRLRLSFAF